VKNPAIKLIVFSMMIIPVVTHNIFQDILILRIACLGNQDMFVLIVHSFFTEMFNLFVY
jgi:hypothetical protein